MVRALFYQLGVEIQSQNNESPLHLKMCAKCGWWRCANCKLRRVISKYRAALEKMSFKAFPVNMFVCTVLANKTVVGTRKHVNIFA